VAGWDLSAVAFTALLALVGGERLAEQVVARRHERRLAARGGRPVGDGHYPVMVALHAAFFAACLAEVWLLGRPFVPALGWSVLAVVTGTMALRWWVIDTLGERWTTRIWVLPGEPRVTGGPFRFLAHPNYLAVAVELFALPLVHTAWVTAAVFGGANLLLLAHRIKVEEAALAAAAGRPSAG
jgi:methyltransferase